MPLSEHEQRLLEQMERALYAEDPKLASALRGADPRTHARRRVLIASVGFIVGIALLMAGVVAQQVIVGVVGFVLMVAAAFVGLSSWRALPASAEPATGGKAAGTAKPPRTRASMMSRFEDRWNRRREENGR